MTSIHSLVVFINSVDIHFIWIVMLFVSFYTFKAFNTMIECCICGIEIKVLELCNLWLLPSTVGTVEITH